MPFTGTAIGLSIAAPIIGAIIGEAASSGDRDAQQKAYAQMMDAYEKGLISAEDLKAAIPKLQDVKYKGPAFTGGYTPEQMEAFLAGPTAYEQMAIDPRLKAAQMQALQQMQQIGAEGLTEEDKAMMNQLQRDTAREDRSRQAAILQNLAQRGMAGSGMELAQKLASSQAASEQAAEGADRQAIAAAQRKMQGIQAANQIAQGARGQEFTEQGALASARDAIAKFNAQNSQSASQFNAASGTEANRYTAMTEQDLAKLQADYDKQAQYQNKIANPTATYGMQATANTATQNALANMANGNRSMAGYYGDEAQDTRNMWSGIGSGVSKGLGAGAGFAGGGASASTAAGGNTQAMVDEALKASEKFKLNKNKYPYKI